MKLSIVIVNWNTRRLLEACLGSLFESRSAWPFEVWVVDNASVDGSRDLVREKFPQARLIANRENAGFARANNQAIRQSAGEYVLLLNPDTVVQPGALQALVDFLEARPQAGAAGPRLLNPDRSLQVSCYPSPSLLREFWRMFHLEALRRYAFYPMEGWSLAEPREVDVLLGACLLLRRAALQQVGLLDEDYFIYSEEVDLCYRVKHAGWKLYWVPRAEVIHYGGESTQQAAEEMFLRLYQGKILFFRKHHGRRAAHAYKAILLLASVARLALSPFALLEAPARRRRHLVLTHHYRRLLQELPDF